jgi:hypothetical protein
VPSRLFVLSAAGLVMGLLTSSPAAAQCSSNSGFTGRSSRPTVYVTGRRDQARGFDSGRRDRARGYDSGRSYRPSQTRDQGRRPRATVRFQTGRSSQPCPTTPRTSSTPPRYTVSFGGSAAPSRSTSASFGSTQRFTQRQVYTSQGDVFGSGGCSDRGSHPRAVVGSTRVLRIENGSAQPVTHCDPWDARPTQSSPQPRPARRVTFVAAANGNEYAEAEPWVTPAASARAPAALVEPETRQVVYESPRPSSPSEAPVAFDPVAVRAQEILTALEAGRLLQACGLTEWTRLEPAREEQLRQAFFALLPSPRLIDDVLSRLQSESGLQEAPGLVSLLRILGNPPTPGELPQ